MLRYCFSLLCLSTSLFAAIHEIAHFRELEEYTTTETTVLIDIDDTLLTPAQMLGSDIWFEYRLQKKQAEGISFAAALEKTLAEWEAIRHLSRMHLVEPDISQVIESIQKKGASILGITVQGLALASRTVLQLQEHKINLCLTAPHPEDRCISVQSHTVLYRQGILFTSGKSKGESFFKLCDALEEIPERIVAIDDKAAHLLALEKEAMQRGIEFIGLRYRFSDEKKAAFSPEIADYQLSHSTFTHLLSDEEAIDQKDRWNLIDSINCLSDSD